MTLSYLQDFTAEPVGSYNKPFVYLDSYGTYEQSSGVVLDDGGNHVFGPARPSTLNARSIQVAQLVEGSDVPLESGYASADFRMMPTGGEAGASTSAPILTVYFPSTHDPNDYLSLTWPIGPTGVQCTLFETGYGPTDPLPVDVTVSDWHHVHFEWEGDAYTLTISRASSTIFTRSGTLPDATGSVFSFRFGASLFPSTNGDVNPYDGLLDNLVIFSGVLSSITMTQESAGAALY